jgi:hypothetical protein
LSAYLDIAEKVLRAARRPMTPRAIMKAAFSSGVVPSHLFGRAQHKTLQARLSEEILHNGLESRFFRTDPGYFFLSELRSDPSIPNEYKDPFHARRRTRDLQKDCALAVDRSYALGLDQTRFDNWKSFLKHADFNGALKHVDSRLKQSNLVFVWAFSIVKRGDQILCYNVGRYRDDRSAFTNRKSIGFAELVGYDNASLFTEDSGITECGLNAVLTDLDLSRSAFQDQSEFARPSILLVNMAGEGSADPVILFIMEWQCPNWFEPTARRLSLNDVRWIDGTHLPNDIDEFEPWSATALAALTKTAGQRPRNGEKNTKPSGCASPI